VIDIALYFKETIATPEFDRQSSTLTLSGVSPSKVHTVILRNVFVGEASETKDLLA